MLILCSIYLNFPTSLPSPPMLRKAIMLTFFLAKSLYGLTLVLYSYFWSWPLEVFLVAVMFPSVVGKVTSIWAIVQIWVIMSKLICNGRFLSL